MLCRIADLLTEVPEAYGLPQHCSEYRIGIGSENTTPDIVISSSDFCLSDYPELSEDVAAYCEAGRLFHWALPKFSAMMLHASAVAAEGGAFLFSAPCGTGKSTHTRLWQELLGSKAVVLNDDKPTLRRIDGVWYAYGTPWCGKDYINTNARAPLAGICFLQQARENRIRRLSPKEALFRLFDQTSHGLIRAKVDRQLSLIGDLIEKIPVYLLENRPELDAARLSYETMQGGRK